MADCQESVLHLATNGCAGMTELPTYTHTPHFLARFLPPSLFSTSSALPRCVLCLCPTYTHTPRFLVRFLPCYDLTKGTQDKGFSDSFFDSPSLFSTSSALPLCVLHLAVSLVFHPFTPLAGSEELVC